ncbi:hypothetical protein J5X84_39740 [Streptosporangiaceae bacterium NEAU-GS5]|nr:hypothetical protein [Streptosporangiaceae bacterium NEAU-GS5]
MIHDRYLSELLKEETTGSSVVSLYFTVPDHPAALPALATHLASLAQLTDPTLGQSTEEAIRRAVEDSKGDHGGVVLFVTDSAGHSKRLALASHPPESVHVGVRPYLRPLVAILHRSMPYCLAVFDDARAWIGVNADGRLVEVATVRDEVMRASNFGDWHGLAEHRVHGHARMLRHRHLRHVAQLIEETMHDHDATVVVLGGHAHDLPLLMALLPATVQQAVAGHIVADPATMNASKVRSDADEVIAHWRAATDARLAVQVLDQAAAGAHAVMGVAACLAAAGEGAIRQLLVEEGPGLPGAVCHNCATVFPEGPTCCPVCLGAVHPVPDVLEEAVVTVLRRGGEVIPLPPYLLEGAHMAARLRRPAK